MLNNTFWQLDLVKLYGQADARLAALQMSLQQSHDEAVRKKEQTMKSRYEHERWNELHVLHKS
eukprot:3094069-Amphidinium_carterae.1